MRTLYSNSFTASTREEQFRSFSLPCYKELETTSENKQSDCSVIFLKAFRKTPISKSIRNHIESGLLEQSTWTASKNRTITPSRRAGAGSFVPSAHNNAIATAAPQKHVGKRKHAFLQETAELYSEQMHVLSHPAL